MTFGEMGLYVIDKKYGNVCTYQNDTEISIKTVQSLYKRGFVIENFNHVQYSYGEALQMAAATENVIGLVKERRGG